MHTADILTLFAFLSELLLGLASASPISLSPAVMDPPSPDRRVSPTPAARRDDDHLCFGLTDIAYDYGNQHNQTGTIPDCENLLKQFKGLTDVQGNITNFCGGPIPGNDSDAKSPAGFHMLGSQGNCALWSECFSSETQVQVA